MKRIEDAPKELQQMFATIFDEWWTELCPNYGTTWMYDHRREVLEHYFLKGFDAAMATGGLPQKPKRTIEEFRFSPQGIILVKSSDGKLFMTQGFEPSGNPPWKHYPDLPQD